jgi:hypothetical protein
MLAQLGRRCEGVSTERRKVLELIGNASRRRLPTIPTFYERGAGAHPIIFA